MIDTAKRTDWRIEASKDGRAYARAGKSAAECPYMETKPAKYAEFLHTYRKETDRIAVDNAGNEGAMAFASGIPKSECPYGLEELPRLYPGTQSERFYGWRDDRTKAWVNAWEKAQRDAEAAKPANRLAALDKQIKNLTWEIDAHAEERTALQEDRAALLAAHPELATS